MRALIGIVNVNVMIILIELFTQLHPEAVSASFVDPFYEANTRPTLNPHRATIRHTVNSMLLTISADYLPKVGSLSQ